VKGVLLIKDLLDMCVLYECGVQSIEGLCSAMPENEPSVVDYIRWLSTEVTGLLEVFAGTNENFVSATVEGTLVMAGNSVNHAALQASAADSGSDILPGERDVHRTAHVVSQKWWHSFGYKSTLASVQARLHEVNVHAQCIQI
jgi:hypothetical protein